jgi:hypothetical protein
VKQLISFTEVAMFDSQRALGLILLLPLTFCGKPEAQSSAPPAAASSTTGSTAPAAATVTTAPPAVAAPAPAAAGAVIATADGEKAGVTASLKELKRSSGDTISMKLVITNGSDKSLPIGYDFGDREREVADFDSIGGVQLIDPVGKKKYFVARDSEGKCICSRGLKDINAGASINVWAKFPAPPADVQKISVIIPHFSPMDDVPIGN